MSGSFDESQHPRGDHGRFAAGVAGSKARLVSSFRALHDSTDQRTKDRWADVKARAHARMSSLDNHGTAILRDHPAAPDNHAPPPSPPRGEGRPAFGEKRSNIRQSSAWSIGSKLAELPPSYTGSKERELPVGSFKHHVVQWQVPKATTVEQHQNLVAGLVRTVQANREGAVETAHERGLIPEGTAKHSIHRAYNHAALLAMHAYGVLDYDFKMDDHLKAEMKPLEPFIRFAERRNRSEMLGGHKGAWRPYRAEFGQKFSVPKYDRATGAERLRVRPNQVLVKAFGSPAPNVLPPTPGVSRFDRYRAAIARDESMGVHSTKPLTQGQQMQRRKAGLAERMKVRSGAMKLQAGMPGSLSGMHIGGPTTTGISPHQPGVDGPAPTGGMGGLSAGRIGGLASLKPRA